MTTLVNPPVPWSPLSGLVPYRLSVEKYEAMVASGAFTKRDRLELIEGILVRKMTKGRKHSTGTVEVRQTIEAVLPPRWHVRIETPVRLPNRDSMPEPNVSVALGLADDYLDLDPGPDDVALIVEVSDTTLAADRALAATYGGGRIPVSWIVNLIDRQIEVYANPVDGVCPAPVIIPETGHVDLVIDGQIVARIPAADFLPRRQ